MAAILLTDDEEKHDKQMQAMIYAISNYPSINRTKLMKFIFFIDLFMYNRKQQTLLENTYIRLPNGPVPKFGFFETRPNESGNAVNNYFCMRKIADENHPEYYYYQFVLKPGVSANLEKFDSFEKDLMGLVLDTIRSRQTNYLSQKSHTYNLWKKYDDKEYIRLNDFKLDDSEKDELELFLNTKVYLAPSNRTGMLGLKKIENKSDKPIFIPEDAKNLPVYIDTDTGEPIRFSC